MCVCVCACACVCVCVCVCVPLVQLLFIATLTPVAIALTSPKDNTESQGGREGGRVRERGREGE